MNTTKVILGAIKVHISKEKAKLDRDEVDEIDLKGVHPSIIEDIFGDFDDTPEFNGWQGDYWAKNSEYVFSGCMYYGTVNISKRKEDK